MQRFLCRRPKRLLLMAKKVSLIIDSLGNIACTYEYVSLVLLSIVDDEDDDYDEEVAQLCQGKKQDTIIIIVCADRWFVVLETNRPGRLHTHYCLSILQNIIHKRI